MTTSIHISKKLQKVLLKRKTFAEESLEEVIWGLIENSLKLNAETSEELTKARAEIKVGKSHNFVQIKNRMDK